MRAFGRRLPQLHPEPPIPPPLPPGRIVAVPGRGEVFVREAPGPRGAPTVLLLHGWTASADLNWWRVYPHVPEVGSLLAPDHRGHGRGLRSDEPFTLEAAADDAAALLEHLGTGPAIVCGYSMGGPISMLLWRRHPHLVKGLVFEATALEWRASARERVIWKTMGLVEFVLRLGPSKGLVERFLRQSIETSPDLAPHRGWLKGELRRGDPADLAQAGRALGEYDARSFASSVDVPTAVVVTTKDRLVRPRKQRALAKAIKGSVVYELAGDHDASLVLGTEFAAVTLEALRAVGAGVAVEEVAEARRA